MIIIIKFIILIEWSDAKDSIVILLSIMNIKLFSKIFTYDIFKILLIIFITKINSKIFIFLNIYLKKKIKNIY